MNKEFIKVLATILGTFRIDKNGKVVEKLEYYELWLAAGCLETMPNHKENIAYQEATEIIRLVPLSEFIDELEIYLSEITEFHDDPNESFSNLFYKYVSAYKEFITQQLTKGQLKELFNTDILKANDFCFHEIDEVKKIEHFINNGVELN